MNQTGTIENTKIKTKYKKPKKMKIILLNDDFTTMEFVIFLLMTVFHLELKESIDIMRHVHEQGSGVAGIYPEKIAKTLYKEAIEFIAAYNNEQKQLPKEKRHLMPLQLKLEEE